MRKDTFRMVLGAIALAGCIALGFAVTMAPAATQNRYSGNYWVYTCDSRIDPIASQTDATLHCAWDMPQDAELEGFQAYCVTEGGTSKTFELMEGAAVTATLELDAAATVVSVFTAGAGTNRVADEASMTITYTTIAAEVAADCNFVVQFRLR